MRHTDTWLAMTAGAYLEYKRQTDDLDQVILKNVLSYYFFIAQLLNKLFLKIHSQSRGILCIKITMSKDEYM